MTRTAPPDEVIRAAVSQANMSPCGKSKRGVVLYARGDGRATIAGRGFNSLPGGQLCSLGRPAADFPADLPPSVAIARCVAQCARRCVHAEIRAIRATINAGYALRAFTAVHVKTVDGKLVAGRGPSCAECAKEVLDVNLEGFWLFEGVDHGVWRHYTAAEFHSMTMRACGLQEGFCT